jgi:putative ABC transport system substrate-binding protein
VTRREFIALLGGAAVLPVAGRAQPPATPVIGFLEQRSPDINPDLLRGFHRGLKDTGYVERENVTIRLP